MRKVIYLISIVLLVAVLQACGNKPKPDERIADYVKEWNALDFTKMYDLLANETIKTYPKEKFIDRYEKIYKDLNVKDLKVTYKDLSDKALKDANDKGKATFPISVEMNTIAGPVNFDTEATIIKEEKDKKENWYVVWNPGLIFPQMKDGGSIDFQAEIPRRGEILDRNKMPLAINDTAYEIGLIPEQFTENTPAIKQRVASLLGMSEESLNKALAADWVKPNFFVPIKKISITDENLLNELWQIQGVSGKEINGRIYPTNAASAHLVGYIGEITAEELKKDDQEIYRNTDMVGKRGIEQLYEKELRGKKGLKIVVKKENKEDQIIAQNPAIDGESIMLTIDSVLQERIYASYEGEAGTTAAIDPKTGETLALVSSPAFNPNNFIYGVSSNQLAALENDPKKPLINRFSAIFAPGSVIKPVTAAIGLKNGVISPTKGIEIDGLTWSNGKGWGDYKVKRVSGSTKPVDVTDALTRSDNIFFARKAVEMGSKAYIDGLKEFGFGEKLPFVYPYTASSISKTGDFSNEVLLANSSYGQGQLEISALHMALAYAPFLNEGKMFKPTLLTTEEKGQIWHDQLINKENALVIQNALRNVVVNGTAKAASNAGIAISGKTGTAELKLAADETGHENSWFVAYPTDKQNIIITMMMEKTEGKGHIVVDHVAKILSDWEQ